MLPDWSQGRGAGRLGAAPGALARRGLVDGRGAGHELLCPDQGPPELTGPGLEQGSGGVRGGSGGAAAGAGCLPRAPGVLSAAGPDGGVGHEAAGGGLAHVLPGHAGVMAQLPGEQGHLQVVGVSGFQVQDPEAAVDVLADVIHPAEETAVLGLPGHLPVGDDVGHHLVRQQFKGGFHHAGLGDGLELGNEGGADAALDVDAAVRLDDGVQANVTGRAGLVNAGAVVENRLEVGVWLFPGVDGDTFAIQEVRKPAGSWETGGHTAKTPLPV